VFLRSCTCRLRLSSPCHPGDIPHLSHPTHTHTRTNARRSIHHASPPLDPRAPLTPQPRERHPRLGHLHRARQAKDRHLARRRLRSQATGPNPLRFRCLSLGLRLTTFGSRHLHSSPGDHPARGHVECGDSSP